MPPYVYLTHACLRKLSALRRLQMVIEREEGINAAADRRNIIALESELVYNWGDEAMRQTWMIIGQTTVHTNVTC